MCEDGGMDDFSATYLCLDATVTLCATSVALAGAETAGKYPAREVAAAIARARHIRWASRRPPERPDPSQPLAPWSDLRWRWREDDREMVIGFRVAEGAERDAEALWRASEVNARCHYADFVALALTLSRRFLALGIRCEDGRVYTVREYIAEVALARLAPALASDDGVTRERAQAEADRYAELLASAPAWVEPDVAWAAAPFTILYSDEHLLAVEKPAGVVTHPTYKHPGGTLTDAVFAQQAALGLPRPWLLHRLDKQTSGVVLFARSDLARRSVVSQIERHTLRKRYLALVVWPPALAAAPSDGEVDTPLARDPLDRRLVIVTPEGQPARTRYRLLAAAGGYALVQAEPVTGRTHQIRAHLASLGAPLLGDVAYLPEGNPARDLAPRVMLHAWRLDLAYPGSGAPWSVTAAPPADFAAVAEALGLGDTLRAIVSGA